MDRDTVWVKRVLIETGLGLNWSWVETVRIKRVMVETIQIKRVTDYKRIDLYEFSSGWNKFEFKRIGS